MITSWRITAAEHAGVAFDGEGARTYGGRWNSPGVAVVYTSSSAALAALELLVRIRQREALTGYVLFACTFAEDSVWRPESLPPNWRNHPAPPLLKQIGDRWAGAAQPAVMEVPSAIIQTESNYILNPAHPDFPTIRIAEPIPFALDVRLLQ